MKSKKRYDSNWLSNVSVALLLVGGFQHDVLLHVRLIALVFAIAAFILGRKLAKED